MSRALVEPPSLPPLDEATARANADALRQIGAEYGITNLSFASVGRLLGHVEPDRDLADMADFQLAVEARLAMHADIFSDGVIDKAGVSLDLVHARPL